MDVHIDPLENPLVQVLKLVQADPKLRRLFINNPALVFKNIGLGCPADFVSSRGKFCPVMPDLPDGPASFDILDPYWNEWLRGGVDQINDFKKVLSETNCFPTRSSFRSEEEWKQFYNSVKNSIDIYMKNRHYQDEMDDDRCQS